MSNDAVPRRVRVHARLDAPVPEPAHVVPDLADRAAGVVLAGEDQQRGLDRVHVRDRVALRGTAPAPRPASRRTAPGPGPGASAPRPRTLRRSPRPARPAISEAQRSGCRPAPSRVDVPAPRPAGQHDPRRVRETARDDVVEPREDVLELEEADVPGELVTPLLSEPLRAAVVDHRDQEPGVDVGQEVGRPAVHVQRVRAAVDAHDAPGTGPRRRGGRGSRGRAGRCGFSNHQASNGRPVGARGPFGLEERHVRADREQPGGMGAVVAAVPDARRRDGRAAAVMEPGSVSSAVVSAGRDVVAVELVTALDAG